MICKVANIMLLEIGPIQLALATAQDPQVLTDAREVKFIASNDSPIERYDWFKGEKYMLSFLHTAAAVNLLRVDNKQCMFIGGHSGFFSEPNILGQVTAATISNNELITTHLIGGNDQANQYWLDVERGVIPGVSIECQVKKLTVKTPAVYEEQTDRYGDTYRVMVAPAELVAEEWELLAVASVVIPAIVGAKNIESNQKKAAPMLVRCDRTGYEWAFENTETIKHMSNPNAPTAESDRISQLVSEIKELKLTISDQEKALGEGAVLSAKAALSTNYWRLRTQAIDLYALQNRYTAEDFKIDFNDDPQIDLDQLFAMSADESRLHLMGIDRDLARAAKRNPIDRVKAGDRELLSSSSIEATPDREPAADQDAALFMATYKPRKIGK